MKVWEAHRDLSLSIGDSCSITSTSIPNGVRFSKSLRDSYLYRAMLEIYRTAMIAIAALPHKQASLILQSMFPASTMGLNIPLSGQAIVTINGVNYVMPTAQADANYTMYNKLFVTFTQSQGAVGVNPILNPSYPYIPIYIYSARIVQPATNFSVPLPIKKTNDEDGLLNMRNVQRPDMWCSYQFYNHTVPSGNEVIGGILDIYDSYQTLSMSDTVVIKYLVYPLNPAYQQMTDELTIDNTYLNKVISLATLYAMVDGQDIENIDRYLPITLMEQPMMGGRRD